MRLWSDYMHEEYGDLDCDFVFVNLWAGGRAAADYSNVDRIVERTQRKVGFHFTPHRLRHTYATLAYREGVQLEVIGAVLTHRSPTSTLVYTHPTAEDLRAVLASVACWRRSRTLGGMSAEPLRVVEGGRGAARLGGVVGGGRVASGRAAARRSRVQLPGRGDHPV